MIHLKLTPELSLLDSPQICPINNFDNAEAQWKNCTNVSLLKFALKYIKVTHDSNSKFPIVPGIPTRWWQWPLMGGHLIDYYDDHNFHRIFLHLNIFNSFLVFVSIFVSLYIIFNTLLNPEASFESLKNSISLLIFLFGYLSSLVPFSLVPRSTFLYHYSISLMFGFLMISSYLNILSHKYPILSYILSVLIIIGSVTSYVIYSPLIYGFELNNKKLHRLMFRSGWLFDKTILALKYFT